MKYTQIYCDICNDIIYNDHPYIMIKNRVFKLSILNPKDLCEECFKTLLSSENIPETIKEIKRMAKYKNSHEAT